VLEPLDAPLDVVAKQIAQPQLVIVARGSGSNSSGGTNRGAKYQPTSRKDDGLNTGARIVSVSQPDHMAFSGSFSLMARISSMPSNLVHCSLYE
jgi:hypothetical protein